MKNICGITRMDRETNEEVRGRTSVVGVLGGRAEQSVLRCLGQMQRMSEERLVKRLT